MYHFFVSPYQIGEKEIRIEGSDVNHIKNVLRMRPGEMLRLCTGLDNMDYRCEIARIEEEAVVARILWVEESGVELPSRLYLFQGLPKSDKMELIIQKAVELGVYEIIPMATARSVVKLDSKKAEAKVKRWNAISESAAKQSKRMLIPKVGPVMNFEDMEKTRKILKHITPGQSVGIFIGPEGGFEEQEVEAALRSGAQSITLGRRILRTETAGMTVLSALMLLLERR